MSLLIVSSVTLRMGGRTLLEGADLTVDAGRRIGLVGRNGAGKSTLLKAIAGDLAVDGGDIRLSSRARMAQVKQTAPSGPASLLDTVLEGDQERLRLLAEAAEAERGHIPPDPRRRHLGPPQRHRCRHRPCSGRHHPGRPRLRCRGPGPPAG